MNIPNTRALLFFLLTFCYWLAKGNEVGFSAEQSHVDLAQWEPGQASVRDADRQKELQEPAEFVIAGETEQVQGLKKPLMPESPLPVVYSGADLIAASLAAHSETRRQQQTSYPPPVPYYILFRSIRVPYTRA